MADPKQPNTQLSQSLEPLASAVDSCVYSVNQLTWQVNQHKILNDISFDIRSNEFVGIVGPNGAGKSSLLRCLYGKNKLTSGSILFNGKPLSNFSRRRIAQEVAVLIQEPPTQFDFSVFDVVAMGLIPNRPLLSFSSLNDKGTVLNAIAKVELSHKVEDSFNTLSGGEKQRVMVARAIVQNPKVLILDEPTNHLDVQHQIDVLKLAKEMKITVLLSIHDLNMAAAFCDRLILLDKGKIVTTGHPDSVLTQQNLNKVFKINALVDQHPFHSGHRITYDFTRGPINSDGNYS